MIHGLLIFFLGIVVGTTCAIFLMALLSANKKDDMEHAKLESYKDGYQKGFDDGYYLQNSHIK